ncbi:hypothetical protein ABW19_dt0206965 [Dactylella cylindrospora]|nr:hypothetical protein ABW19_dt0206965 [Dactylella cylindrospora]
MAAQLVKLPDIERLSPRVIRILGGNPGKTNGLCANLQFTLQGTNTYLLGTGPRRLLIDTGEGVPVWRSSISSVLSDEKATVSSIIITHWHHDHVGGVEDIRSLCPDVNIYRHASFDGDTPLQDGEELSVEGATVTVHHTPGHTADHLCIFLKEEEALFTGDNVLGQGTTVFEDLSSYMSSLQKMLSLNPEAAYPAHGPFIPDAKSKISEYIKHRKDREDQILQVLRSEDGSAKGSMEIVKIIYKDYPENLYEPAEKGVLQVLNKLLKDGIVSREGEKWKIQQVGGGGDGESRAKRRSESVL